MNRILHRAARAFAVAGIVTMTAAAAHAQVPEARLAELRAERDAIRLDLPIALRVTGGLLLGGGVLVAGAVALAVPTGRNLDISIGATEPTMHDDTALHGTLVSCAIGAGVGLVLTVLGVTIESERRGRQRAIDAYLARDAPVP